MRKILSLMLGLSLGAAIGVLVVTLFAPTSGEQLVANLKAGWEETLAAARIASAVCSTLIKCRCYFERG